MALRVYQQSLGRNIGLLGTALEEFALPSLATRSLHLGPFLSAGDSNEAVKAPLPSLSRAFATGTGRDRRRVLASNARASASRIREDTEARRRLAERVAASAAAAAPPPSAAAVLPPPPDPTTVGPSSLASVTNHRALMITRDIEWGNVIFGYEQANKYVIRDESGNVAGYIAEEGDGIGSALKRQLLRTHRPFTATVLGLDGRVIFRVKRPFYWINSSLIVEDGEGSPLGEVHQRFHLLKRNYDIYIGKRQFAAVTAPMLAWQFDLRDDQGVLLATIDRNFSGFAKEIFTDAGKYAIHFGTTLEGQGLTDAATPPPPPPPPPQQPPAHGIPGAAANPAVGSLFGGSGLQVQGPILPPAPIESPLQGLTERAVALAAAISIDFDYFSRHSEGGSSGFFPPMFIPMPWGSSESDTATPAAPPPSDAADSSTAAGGGAGGWGWGSGASSTGDGGAGERSAGRDSEELDDSGSFFGDNRGGEQDLGGDGGDDEGGVSWFAVMKSLGKMASGQDPDDD